MITIEEYWMGRDKLYPQEFTEEIQANGERTVNAINRLLIEWVGPPTGVNSGWRPPQVNDHVVKAATHSNHLIALACDLHDKDGSLDTWCVNNPNLLAEIGLWQESPASTPGWCHLQIVPPKSGHRVFIP